VNDRDVLEKSYEIYRPVYKKIPHGDRRAVNSALDQMAKELPETAKVNADDFIDNSISFRAGKKRFHSPDLQRTGEALRIVQCAIVKTPSQPHSNRPAVACVQMSHIFVIKIGSYGS
jgi:hypothetical protein